ncbi:outer membrane beta-barrel family protein [Pontibacter lucknowensis]|uniref:Outer membrane receptor proteins, mostly Fe transport n=1 Tax=Pontibacter lucknowensis TaxID=1077936 RepID=A0A1N6U435_9BACT|nr:outer membrane beta-barrel family protein [Pontibacter lucknowensis]SIQ60408.1 Outer membrane receptor proteins, mostly Fe transport [Pontibacter lucknowensis]
MRTYVLPLFFSALLYLTALPDLQAQDQPSQNTSSTRGKVSGTVQDANSKAPLGFANIVLLTARDSSLVTGATSDIEGKFELNRVPQGQFILRISSVGYPTRFIPNIRITDTDSNIRLGAIPIKGGATQLKEVQIVTERPMVEFELDKKVVNMEQNIAAQGGSVADAMQNVPSVDVDLDGNVSLRGSSNVTILVDGKRTALSNLTLDQIPASMIESVELITNPSSKYDPEGTSGVINLILKKNMKPGFNGTATVNVGTYENYNSSLNLNYRHYKWNFNGGYDFRRSYRPGVRRSFLTNLDEGTFREDLGSNRRTDISHSFRFGADYSINPKNTISASALYRTGDERGFNSILNRNLDGEMNLTRLNLRETRGTEDDGVMDYNLGYRRTFDQKGREWTADVIYTERFSDEVDNIMQRTTLDMGLPVDRMNQQRITSDDKTRRIVAQSDYVHPINEDSRFEAGYRSSFQLLDNDNKFFDLNPETNQWLINDNVTNRFVYDEQVHALYSNYSNKIGSVSFQAGLRAEQTLTKSDQRTQDNGVFRNDYFSLFPSVFVTKDFSPESKVQFSYSRRINRPRAWSLNPFIDYSDTLNIRSGNPELLPEFINSYELGYLKYWDNTSFNTTVFYRRTNDQIQRFRTFDAATGVTSTTFLNLASGSSYGVELVGTYNPYKWWRLNASVSGFRVELNDAGGDTELSNDQWTWNSKLNSTMTVWKDLAIQVSANYRAPMADIQGQMQEIYAVDLGLKKDVLNKKGTITLRVSDIFDTREFNFESFGPGFEQTNNNKRQTRIAFIGFTYRLNSEDNNRERRRQRDEQGGGDDGFDY